MVVVVHQGGNERHDDGAMIVAAMDYVPDGVENVAGSADVGLVCRKLEVAYLTVEGRRHLSLGKRHGKVGEEGKAEDAEVIGKADGVDDGARADIRSCRLKLMWASPFKMRPKRWSLMVKGGFWRISRRNTVWSPRTIPSSLLKKILSLICDRWGVRMSRMRERSIS